MRGAQDDRIERGRAYTRQVVEDTPVGDKTGGHEVDPGKITSIRQADFYCIRCQVHRSQPDGFEAFKTTNTLGTQGEAKHFGTLDNAHQGLFAGFQMENFVIASG